MSKINDYLKRRFFDDVSVYAIIAFGVMLAFASFTPIETAERKAAKRYREEIIFNFLGESSEKLQKTLGSPYFKELLRETEELHYWHYGPFVLIQIHFHKNRASRIAFVTSSVEIRDALEYSVTQQFGRKADWRLAKLDVEGNPLEMRLNRRRNLSLVKYKDSIMVYGYLVPTQKQT